MSCNCNSGNLNNDHCGNPCAISSVNTAACESLPSQISNFTAQFFGEVIKTELDGNVNWTLPCDLNVGLPANPRLDDEGLACYFLRLFMDGITGLTGPQGVPGNDGSDGRNAYTVTLLSFSQPSLASPTVQVKTLYNPAVLVGLSVFIGTSGWYRVDTTDISGNLWLTLIQPVVGVSFGDTITAGKLVVPTGPQGAAITGPTGPTGPAGPIGPTGGTYSTTNGQTAGTGTDYTLTNAFARVVFGTIEPEVTLPVAGKYLITATITVFEQPGAPSSPPDAISFKLWDSNAAAFIPDSLITRQDLTGSQWGVSTIIVIYNSPGNNHTIQIYGVTSGSVGDARVASTGASTTVINYVRLS